MQQPNMSEKYKVKKLALFASGSGSNVQKILEYFLDNKDIKVALIVTNVANAGVVQKANQFAIPVLTIEREPFFRGQHYLDELKQFEIDFIVLAGFLWKIPEPLIAAFKNNIINIHPALLPKYGGKGMYGLKVHQAVIDKGELESGITIHYVDEQYDHGNTITQISCPVFADDTAEALAKRIQLLEHEHLPQTIERLLMT